MQPGMIHNFDAAAFDSVKGKDTDWRRVFAVLYNSGCDGGLSIKPHSATWKGDLAQPGVDFTIKTIRPFILR